MKEGVDITFFTILFFYKNVFIKRKKLPKFQILTFLYSLVVVLQGNGTHLVVVLQGNGTNLVVVVGGKEHN